MNSIGPKPSYGTSSKRWSQVSGDAPKTFFLPKLLANLTSITLEVRGGFASCAALAWRPFCMVNVDSAIMAVGLSCHFLATVGILATVGTLAKAHTVQLARWACRHWHGIRFFGNVTVVVVSLNCIPSDSAAQNSALFFLLVKKYKVELDDSTNLYCNWFF